MKNINLEFEECGNDGGPLCCITAKYEDGTEAILHSGGSGSKDSVHALVSLPTIPDAIKALGVALRKEDGYDMSWRANIAMAVCDVLAEKGVTGNLIHKACNEGALRFIDMLIKKAE